jgi:hypothetical protein
MGRITLDRWRKDRATLLRALRDFETARLIDDGADEEDNSGLDTFDQRIESIKRRIADLEAKLPRSG